MKISIVGTGYVGLVTGACLADKGHEVTCVDVDPERVAALNAAESPIFEAGLDELLQPTRRTQSDARRPISPSAVLELRSDLHRGRHAVQRPDAST